MLLEWLGISDAPFRHTFELLQLEQIRSPHHLLGNAVLHLRHWRTLGVSEVGW
jgi:hypothetical protein